MKKLTLSVTALTIVVSSFGQSKHCKELTLDSIQCKNSTKSKNGLCYLHNPYYTNRTDTIKAKICSGITKRGTYCLNKVKHISGLCHHHRKIKK